MCNGTIDHPCFSFNLPCCIIEILNEILSNHLPGTFAECWNCITSFIQPADVFKQNICHSRHSDVNV